MISKRWIAVAVGVAVVTGTLLLSGCGTGNEPFSMLGDSNQSLAGTMSLPYGDKQADGSPLPVINFTGYSETDTGQNGFRFFVTGITVTVPIIAPLGGMITAVSSESVTIMHNARVSSQINRLSTMATVRVGEFVSQGDRLVTNATSGVVAQFVVLVDGVAVCPVSFLNTTARGQVQVLGVGGWLCQ